jgi:hypothetical protein
MSQIVEQPADVRHRSSVSPESASSYGGTTNFGALTTGAPTSDHSLSIAFSLESVSLYGAINDLGLLKTQPAGHIPVFRLEDLNGNTVQSWWYQRLWRTEFDTHPASLERAASGHHDLVNKSATFTHRRISGPFHEVVPSALLYWEDPSTSEVLTLSWTLNQDFSVDKALP